MIGATSLQKFSKYSLERISDSKIKDDTNSLQLDNILEFILTRNKLEPVLDFKKLMEIDVIEFFKILQKLKKEHGFIKLGNYVIENFLDKNEEELLSMSVNYIKNGHEEKNHLIKFGEDSVGSFKNFTSTIDNKSRASSKTSNLRGLDRTAVHQLGINFAMKNELTQKLIIELSTKSEEKKRKTLKQIRALKTGTEELKYKIKETTETINNFKEVIIDTYLNEQTHKLPAQKYLIYFESWIKNGIRLLSTIKLKMQVLHDNFIFVKNSIIKKKNLGQLITAVDFTDLQQQRDDFLNILDTKNADISKLKVISGKAHIAMNAQKNQLEDIKKYWTTILNKSEHKKRQVSKHEAEAKNIEYEIIQHVHEIKKLSRKTDMYKAPSIEEYFFAKQKVCELEKDKKILLRKIHLLKLQVDNARLKGRNKQRLSQVHN